MRLPISETPSSLPRIVLPLGDPAGIGPEVVLKTLAEPQITQNFEVTVVGNRSLLEQIYRELQLRQPQICLADPDQFRVLDVPLESSLRQQIRMGDGNAASGEASFRFLETAIAQALAGNFHGIVTAPIAKSAWKAAGHHYPGQTELLAEKAGVERFGMLFVARSPHTGWTLRTLLATTHIPLRQVADALTPELMSRKLELLVECLQQDFGLTHPTIAIAGLNPHSGEQGQLGNEEQEWLIPWLQEMGDRWTQVQLEGPVPPDTLWVKPGQAWFGKGREERGERSQESGVNNVARSQEPGVAEAIFNPADAYLALYHDQGLIPVKLMAFDRAVNTSIGLPFVRTSPDHGTAFDIAGKGIAEATSMKAAIDLAVELCRQRQR